LVSTILGSAMTMQSSEVLCRTVAIVALDRGPAARIPAEQAL